MDNKRLSPVDEKVKAALDEAAGVLLGMHEELRETMDSMSIFVIHVVYDDGDEVKQVFKALAPTWLREHINKTGENYLDEVVKGIQKEAE